MNMQTTTTTPKERPILFSAPMVRAILEGRKTQTRRIMRPIKTSGKIVWQPIVLEGYAGFVDEHGQPAKCPYGEPGHRLWVRESFFWDGPRIAYRADHEGYAPKDTPWKPSIYMPRAASRILLEIADVRAERLQDISEEDAKAEGVFQSGFGFYRDYVCNNNSACGTARQSFETLWRSINGHESWQQNPFVFQITFKRLQP